MATVAFDIIDNTGAVVAGPVNATIPDGTTRECPIAIEATGLDPADGPFEVRMHTPAGTTGDLTHLAAATILDPC